VKPTISESMMLNIYYLLHIYYHLRRNVYFLISLLFTVTNSAVYGHHHVSVSPIKLAAEIFLKCWSLFTCENNFCRERSLYLLLDVVLIPPRGDVRHTVSGYYACNNTKFCVVDA
jgi:hypothetical protein